VLLINLGTPEGTDYWSMRRYLNEFLSDPRVIETNRFAWWLILNAVVLTVRPGRSGRNYEKIWNRELDESPLKTTTREQAQRLGKSFGGDGGIIVDWAMRYGNPPVSERLSSLKAMGCDRVLLAPLYPQYSSASTASALDRAYQVLGTMRWQPAIRTLPPYYDHAAYISALGASIDNHARSLPWAPEKLIVSYHGLPEAFHRAGDPYYCHCMKTTRLLSEALGWRNVEILSVFQSRFGREEWLKPYAVDTVERLAQTGTRRLLAVCPGFSADCLETLEEIAIGLNEIFHKNGGTHFSTVPCLNASDNSIAMLRTLVEEQLRGWL
jgi:protoporphyrin/coproporphyrin ferrochelatase